MDIKIDQNDRYQVADASVSALTALDGMNDYLREKGRAVIKLVLDGRPLPADQVAERLKNVPASGLAGLQVETEEISKLVSAALDELEKSTPELAGACHNLAEVFQSEGPEAGYEPFQRLAGIWKVIKEREIQVAMALDVDWDALTVRGESITRLHEDLNDYLAEAAEALKVEDCVLLGDLLEYELAPKAEVEPEIVAMLRSKADAAFQK